MENKIMAVEDMNINELQSLESNLKLAIQTGNADTMRAVHNSLTMCPNTLLGKLIPSKIRKVNDELLIKDMKAIYDDRRAMMQLLVNTQLELTKKQGEMLIKTKLAGYEGALSKQAMAIQADLTDFFQKKYDEFYETIKKTSKHFLAQMKEQEQDLAEYKHIPFLYKRAKESLKKQSEMFFSTIEELQEKFKQALQDKIGTEKENNDQ